MTKRKYTNEERARKGGYALARKRTKRQRREAALRAITIRWARAKGLLGPAPAPLREPVA